MQPSEMLKAAGYDVDDAVPDFFPEDVVPAPFKIGDVVCLRSGGPHMTVSKLDGTTADCVYFTPGGSELHRPSLPIVTLELATFISATTEN